MSNTLKLTLRTAIIIGVMMAGTWLSHRFAVSPSQTGAFTLSVGMLYLVDILLGVAVGSMVAPRFVKGKSKFAYLIPLWIVFIVGISPALHYYIPTLPFPEAIQLLNPYIDFSWVLSGLYASLLFR